MRPVVINPPSIRALLSAWIRGTVGACMLAAVLALLVRPSFGYNLVPPLVPLVAVLVALWTVVVLIQSLTEPTLTINEDGIAVRYWAAKVLRLDGRQYPPQPIDPEEVTLRGGRGGRTRAVQLSLRDTSGRIHQVRFFFISLANFQSALGQSSNQPY
jgi:hypothetical protein